MDVRRLLIANRGEIALRVARACRELGIAPVAIAAPDDRATAHVLAADAVIPVASYLDAAAIVAAALAVGADAVHPGYGFLSEDPRFAEAVGAAGLTWVGPPPSAMRALGDKVAARALAAEVGVPVIAGTTDERKAGEVGYPLLIKAAAGGGGRGMRVVAGPDDLPAALAAAREEAEAAFGDGRVFLERLVTGARHVEMQVALDGHGGAVHLGERDCSLQRRHQKVVEESPSSAVDAALREDLGDAALRVAAAAGYEGVGTAEFLLAEDGAWWFLEMNARLQVEHPVTEAVTGVDLVRAQLRIAAGEPLPWDRADAPALRGHAIEARVYAEDPANAFLPTGGRVALLELPRWPGVRIDTALREGDEVGLGYDPLLAKVIARGEDRAAALARLRAALGEVRIVGVTTNLGFLLDALAHPDVVAGRVDTGWIERVWRPDVPPLPDGAVPAGDPRDPWIGFGAGARIDPDVAVAGGHALYRGWSYPLAAEDLDAATAAGPGDGSVVSPMPATVRAVEVAEGDPVEAGQVVAVLEAMKMHLTVVAAIDGTVRAVHVRGGDVVTRGQLLAEVEAP